MKITRNVFINNGATTQICDEGENNTYNYYDDWTSPDVDSDQIVDTPYSIDGVVGNQDLYPLVDPHTVPPVTTTTNTTTTSTGTGDPIPMEILMIAGGGVIIILVGVFFVKRKV